MGKDRRGTMIIVVKDTEKCKPSYSAALLENNLTSEHLLKEVKQFPDNPATPLLKVCTQSRLVAIRGSAEISEKEINMLHFEEVFTLFFFLQH
jgi:hypothetical protein